MGILGGPAPQKQPRGTGQALRQNLIAAGHSLNLPTTRPSAQPLGCATASAAAVVDRYLSETLNGLGAGERRDRRVLVVAKRRSDTALGGVLTHGSSPVEGRRR